jgi:hypothetical protein
MFLTLIPIISTLLNVLLSVLQANGVTTPAMTSLITSLGSVVTPLVEKLATGSGTTSDVLAVLGALSGVITTLKQNKSINPAVLTQLNDLDEAVDAALAAYIQAATNIDLTVLTQLTPVV